MQSLFFLNQNKVDNGIISRYISAYELYRWNTEDGTSLKYSGLV